MWTAQSEKLTSPIGYRFSVAHDTKQATVADVIDGWRTDKDFRTYFNTLLADAPFTAFRWETPGITTQTTANPFEFVLLESPNLERRPEPNAFAEHFNGPSTVVSFTNLGGDAVMVVPCPMAEHDAYGHLASFVRRAPASQQQTLWQLVGEVMARRIGAKPVWLSTAGAGVSWLHVRLDDRPKYYGYGPYRQSAYCAES